MKICQWSINSWGKLEARLVASIKFEILEMQEDIDHIIHIQFNNIAKNNLAATEISAITGNGPLGNLNVLNKIDQK